LGRWRARQHAASCPSCARESSRIDRIAGMLSAVRPLAPTERALWTSVASVSFPRRARRLRIVAAAAIILVNVGLGAALLRYWPRRSTIEQRVPQIVQVPAPSPQASPAVVRELDGLTANLQALSRELAELSRRAELLDERRDAENLSHRFDRFVALNQ
jgi:hypothetical protein